ncbi:hypothetical protein JYU14_02660 [Simkania negevensis]|uniref:Uncharacterized protein n=1 Tax=Simkania negevensis TaxID=83561 RepID=A0ABS3ARJ0_9BACT|nr:hypothetical protein [Simkania negevensis]
MESLDYLIQKNDPNYWETYSITPKGVIEETLWTKETLDLFVPLIKRLFANLLQEPATVELFWKKQIQLIYALKNTEEICQVALKVLGTPLSIDLPRLRGEANVSVELWQDEELLDKVRCPLLRLLELPYFRTMLSGDYEEMKAGKVSLDLDLKEDLEAHRLFLSGVAREELLKPTTVKQACELFYLGRYFGCSEEFLVPVYDFVAEASLQEEEALYLAEHAYRLLSPQLQTHLSSRYLAKLNPNKLLSFLNQLEERLGKSFVFISLVLRGCNLNEALLDWFQQRADKIVSLDLSHARFHDSNAWVEALKNRPLLRLLNLSGTSIIAIPMRCPNLEEVDASGCHRLNDASGLNGCIKLRILNLSRTLVVAIPMGCVNLEEVYASYCTSLKDVLGLKDRTKLRILNLTQTAVEALPMGCPNLEEVYLSYCIWLRDISSLNGSIELRILDLRDTPVTASPVDCLKLKELYRINHSMYR